MHRKSWTFAFKLEHNHSGIMSGSENVQAGMSSDDPKSVMFASKSVETSTLGHIPNPDGLVFGVGDNKILTGMENHA